MPNYLGTATGLTGIPTLLLSSLGGVEDKAAETALYQVQNWANSFFVWNYDLFNEPSGYTTGGVVFDFTRPFPSNVLAMTATAFTPDASQAQVASLSLTSAKVALWTPTGTELTAGGAYSFSYIAIGH